VLQPKRVKYRKTHKGDLRGKASRGNAVQFGDYGIQATEGGWITDRQIEATRRVMVRYLRRGGKMWIRIFPDKSVTKKPAETRMGSGKGAPDHWVAVVRPGRMLFEIGGIKESLAKQALKQATYKLPLATRLTAREGIMAEV
jgi:large subunit ribosomal protein L16